MPGEKRAETKRGDSMHSHILALLRAQAELFAGATAIETEAGESHTYASLYEHVGRLAGSITAAGFNKSGKRARIGIVLPNGADFAVTLLGVAAAAEAAPFNPSCRPAEFEAYFRATHIDALIVGENERGPAASIAERLEIPLTRLMPGYQLCISREPAELPLQDPDHVALVLMTSGSTGKPKIVPLTHRNVCTSADDVSRSIGLSPSDRCLSMWEQYHIGGLVDLLLAPLASGGCVITTPGFSAPEFFRLLSARRPTWYQGVPTTLHELVFHARQNALTARPNSLRLVRSVAAALDPGLMTELEDLLGVPVIQTFGMTEAGPLISSTRLPPALRKPRSVGRSCGTEIRVIGADGDTLAVKETGEIAVRGPNVFAGYENDPEANHAQFRAGWFLTGDTGFVDADGDLFLTGRIKQLINRGGEKISPQEVDDALLLHPAVAEAASFAVKHRTLGEDIAAAIVLRAPADVDEVRAFLSSRLASFKLPSRLMIVDRLPRNPVGKVDRLALAEACSADSQAAIEQVKPRDELESLLTQLWSRELGLPAIGIFDDFAALGGDSLSSLRILVAIETALKTALPDDIFADFATVARLAERLKSLGIDVPTPRDETGTKVEAEAGEAQEILGSIDVGTLAVEDALNLGLQNLDTCRNEIDFRVIADTATVYSTPTELRTALGQVSQARIGSRAEKTPGLVQRYRLRLAFWRWRRRVLWELAKSATAGDWGRTKLAPGVLLYEGRSKNYSGKTLLIGFTGNYRRLMGPTYRMLCSLEPDRADLLLLSDPSRSLFINGIEAIGGDLDAMGAYLRKFANERGYHRVVTIGTSGGGLAAIYTAIFSGWNKALAVGCASLDRHPDFIEKLKDAAARLNPDKTEIVLAFASGNVRDRDAASQVASILPNAKLSGDERFTNHNLIAELYLRGELPQFLAFSLFGQIVYPLPSTANHLLSHLR